MDSESKMVPNAPTFEAKTESEIESPAGEVEEQLPIFAVREIPEMPGKTSFWCPACKQYHCHGIPTGISYRCAHCVTGPYKARGYYIQLVPGRGLWPYSGNIEKIVRAVCGGR